MPDDSAKRTALAKRMSSLLGLPAEQIEKLIPLVAADDLDRLEGMGDAEFLRESTKVINHAQRQQLDQMEKIAEATSELSVATKPKSEPDSEGSTPKLRPLRKPGEGPVLRRSTPPAGLNETATAGVPIPQESASNDMGGLRRVGESGSSVLPGADATPAIDPLTGLPKEDPLSGAGPAPAAPAAAPAAAPLRRAKGDDVAFTPTSHSTARAEDLDPANDGGDAPKVMAPAEKPPIRAEGEETAETKIPEAFGTRTRTKIPASPRKKKNLLIIGGLGAALGLVLLVLLGLIVSQIFKPEPVGDDPVATSTPPPADPAPVDTVAAPVEDTSVPVVPVVVSPQHEDCLVITGEMDLELPRPDLLKDATSFTLEMWVKIRDPIKVQHFTVDSGGEKPAIKMSLVQGALSGLQFRASMADARQNLVAPPPATGAWTHLAVIYNAGDAPYLKAYTNGELSTEVALLDTPKLSINSLRLTAEVMSRSGVILVDEIRLSSDVVYTGNFNPERALGGERPGTILYIPMERSIGDGALHDAKGDVGVPLAGGTWVSLEKDAASPGNRPLIELKLPQETLDAYAAERGERARAELLERWERLSDEQKRKYLEENGLL